MKGVKTNRRTTKERDTTFIVLAVLLSFPAFFINLGIHPFIEDESIRALVALEMDMNGNYFFPTLGGVPYFAKPPLYNWILLLFSKIFGGLNEWTTRIPTVLFLYGFVAYIYHTHKRANYSSRFSIIVSLLFLTCGRILFWDSFLGLIDVFFSWIMYAMIVEMYFNWKKESFWWFYGLSYFLLSVGFLLKGFPAILFFGLTLVWIIYLDRSLLKRIFCLPHLVSLIIPLALIGGYYLIYNQSGEVENSVSGLLDQATRRTIIRYDLVDVIKHIFLYPFENLYHFLPWSLLVFGLLLKKSRNEVFTDPFVLFCSGAFLINLVPYWLSPEVFPRYILMLVPLIFTCLYRILHLLEEGKSPSLFYQRLFVLMGIGSVVFLAVALLNEKTVLIRYSQLKGGLCLMALVILAWFLVKNNKKVLVLINMLLILRIAFNLFVLPIRTIEDKGLVAKNDALRLVEKYGHQEIRMFEESIRDYTTIFHIEKTIRKTISPAKEADVLIFNGFDQKEMPAGYKIVDSIYVRRVDGYMHILLKD